MMKKSLLFSSVILLLSPLAHAAVVNNGSGTITFNGAVSANTCDISVNGGGNNATITLPTVSKSVFTGIGSTSGSSRFNIKLTNCNPQSGITKVFFENGDTTNYQDNTLINTTTNGAKGIGYELLNANSGKGYGEQVLLGKNYGFQNVQPVTLSNGAGEFFYFVRYYQSGPTANVTAGPVTSRVNYNIVYN